MERFRFEANSRRIFRANQGNPSLIASSANANIALIEYTLKKRRMKFATEMFQTIKNLTLKHTQIRTSIPYDIQIYIDICTACIYADRQLSICLMPGNIASDARCLMRFLAFGQHIQNAKFFFIISKPRTNRVHTHSHMHTHIQTHDRRMQCAIASLSRKMETL